MLKNLSWLSFIFVLISIQSYAQVGFEPGYFLDNDGLKKECLIENKGWLNNPTQFNYKLSNNDPILTGDIANIKAFGIGTELKYVRSTIQIDRSNDDLEKLSTSRNPEFQTETLWLKVLVEGEANLYSYTDKNLNRFFFSTADIQINQLVHKNYFVTDTQIGENNMFRQQLLTQINCGAPTSNQVKTLRYSAKDLVRYFSNHNKCSNGTNIIYRKEKRKSVFVTIKGGTIMSWTIVTNSPSSIRNLEFKPGYGLKLSMELEYVFSFNKNITQDFP
jgi:hypothetical protein